MAEFTIEQLKTVLDNMVDSLDQTKGDEGTHAELQQIKHLIRDIKAQIAKDASNDTKENKALVKNFFEEWDRQNPLRDLRKSVDELNKKSDNPLRQGGGGGNNNNNNGGGGDQAGGNPLTNMFNKQEKATESQMKAGKLLAATLGTALTAAGLSLNYLKEQATAYRSLMATAEGSIGSIAEMKDTAAMNGMSTQELIQTMQRERNLRVLGAKDFAKWNKQIRDATLYTGQMGMTFEDIAGAQDAYVASLRSAGLVHSEGINTMTARLIDLVAVNQKMATIMGKTREEQLEAMKKEAEDANFQGVLRGMGLSPDQFNKVFNFISTLDEAGKRLFKQAVYTGGSPTDTASAQYMTLNPEMGRAIVEQAKALKGSGAIDPVKAALAYRDAARLDTRDKGQDGFFGLLGQMDGANPAFAAAMAARANALSMNEKGEPEDRTSGKGLNDGEKAIMSIEDQGRRVAAAFDDIANQGFKAATSKFGDTMLGASKALTAFTDDVLHAHARYLENHPNQAMVEGGLMGILANAGMFAGGAATMWGAGKLFGRGGGGAARAGAGAGAARAGGIGSKLGTAAKVGGKFLGAAGGAYGMYDGYQTLAQGGTSMWDKVYGYGSSIAGGAAVGAAGGSLFAGVGAIPGALIGGVAGLGSAIYSDWTHPDGAANAAGGGKVKMPSGVQNLKQAANATGGNKTNDPATMMMKLETKLLEVSTASLNQLVDIKKSHHRQLELMREDIGANKAATDRLARLLEESNRNTKQIGGLT